MEASNGRVTILPKQIRRLAELAEESNCAIAIAQNGSVLHFYNGSTKLSVDARGNDIHHLKPGDTLLKKDITYTNPFTNAEETETHYFHISKADLVEMEMEEHNLAYSAKDGKAYTGMQAKLMKIIDSEDGKAILGELKDIVRRSYGQKIGDRFLKSPDATAEFMSSEAFSQLLYELCTDAEKAAEFTNGIIPGNLTAEVENIARQSADISDAEEAETTSPSLKAVEDLADRTGADFPKGDDDVSQGGSVATEARLLTDAEIRTMGPDELRSGVADGRYRLS